MILDNLVLLTSVFLCLSKFPDLITTYQGIKRAGSVQREKNRFALRLFEVFGLLPGMLLVMLIYFLVLGITLYTYWTSEGQTRVLYGIVLILYSLFVSVVQVQVAIVNRGGLVREPLKTVLTVFGRFYK